MGSTMAAARTLASICLAGSAVGAGTAVGDEGFLIDDVTVVDVEGGRTEPRRSVVISGGRIVSITPSGGGGGQGLHRIEGSGLYLMPGLFDAHVHFSASPETFGPLLVAHGVTCIRDTGAPTDLILGLRSQARQDASTIPDIICTGAIVDGDPPIWPFSEPCDEPQEARAAVRKLHAAGVDQIKVYTQLPREAYLAAVQEAHALGLKVTGHVPTSVTLREALEAGQDCCEHLTGFDGEIGRLAGWQPPDGETSPFAWFGAWGLYSTVGQSDLASLAAAVARSGMHQCPTLVVRAGVVRAADQGAAQRDPRMAYVPATLRSSWGGAQAEMARHAASAVAPMTAMVGELHRAGVPLMVGTDLANAYVFAGSAVHEEMRSFQEAGIGPAEVLRAATVVPARFCGVAGSLGAVQEGKVASLVLVAADPLEDVANAARIEGVFLRGRFLDRAALDALLEDVRAAVAATLPRDEEVELSLPGAVVRRGRYRLRFGEFDAGAEDFLITRDADGYHIMAHSRPQGGPNPPFLLTAHVAGDFTFREATWRVLAGEPLEATYRLEGPAVKAISRRGGDPPASQILRLPQDAILSGPAFATELATLGAARLAAGQSRTFQFVSFGSGGWELRVTPGTIGRLEDETLSVEGGPQRARVYRTTLETDWGRFEATSWTDPQGVLLRSVMTMPFGTLTARLEGLAE
jgi:imidazolonepropionase-like amidohydrolase